MKLRCSAAEIPTEQGPLKQARTLTGSNQVQVKRPGYAPKAQKTCEGVLQILRRQIQPKWYFRHRTGFLYSISVLSFWNLYYDDGTEVDSSVNNTHRWWAWQFIVRRQGHGPDTQFSGATVPSPRTDFLEFRVFAALCVVRYPMYPCAPIPRPRRR